MKQVDETQQSDAKSAHHLRKSPIPGTSRLAVLAGIIVLGILYFILPESLTIGPSWLLPTIEIVLMIPLVVLLFTNNVPHIAIRLLSLALLAVVTIGLIGGIVLLIKSLPHNTNATSLLRSAVLLWCSNVLVFALWYWEIDGGGPRQRHLAGHQAADLMFPQQADGNKSGWAPHFLDYVFVAFTGATALSPTDTYPLTRTAKMLMMIEACISLVIVALLAARAVNILGG